MAATDSRSVSRSSASISTPHRSTMTGTALQHGSIAACSGNPPDELHTRAGPDALGLIPSWATDPSIGFKTINARSETITTTASFSDPFRARRCLIPADGFFYEWLRRGKTK